MINVGSGNGLVLSGSRPLPEPMLTPDPCPIWRHLATKRECCQVSHPVALCTATLMKIEPPQISSKGAGSLNKLQRLWYKESSPSNGCQAFSLFWCIVFLDLSVFFGVTWSIRENPLHQSIQNKIIQESTMKSSAFFKEYISGSFCTDPSRYRDNSKILVISIAARFFTNQKLV